MFIMTFSLRGSHANLLCYGLSYFCYIHIYIRIYLYIYSIFLLISAYTLVIVALYAGLGCYNYTTLSFPQSYNSHSAATTHTRG